LAVDTFLLSCRVLGRGVEHRMLAALGKIACERGVAVVEAPLVRTARNMPALLFLESVGLEFQQVEAGSLCFRFSAARAAGVRYQPGAAPARPGREISPVPAAAPPPRIPYARIASELRDPARILARIQSHRPGRPGNRAAYAAPRTELERRLAEIWADSLRVSPVGIFDDFFDLGGHSLLAVQLMSRVRQEFGVDLSLELVYSGAFNVAELAAAIEVKEIQSTGAGQYAALLQELEALSDDEVRALLAQEGDPSCESS
jgi:acyl carrier protein